MPMLHSKSFHPPIKERRNEDVAVRSRREGLAVNLTPGTIAVYLMLFAFIAFCFTHEQLMRDHPDRLGLVALSLLIPALWNYFHELRKPYFGEEREKIRLRLGYDPVEGGGQSTPNRYCWWTDYPRWLTPILVVLIVPIGLLIYTLPVFIRHKITGKPLPRAISTEADEPEFDGNPDGLFRKREKDIADTLLDLAQRSDPHRVQ